MISFLEDKSDTDGREFANVILHSLLSDLNSTVSISKLARVLNSIAESIKARDLLLYFDENEIQEESKVLSLAGSMSHSENDFLYIVDSNIGWSKSDPNIGRMIKYKLDFTDLNRPVAHLEMEYKNFSGISAADCEPQWLDRGDTYTQLKNACYWDCLLYTSPSPRD
mgnify:CR=1 FL=1